MKSQILKEACGERREEEMGGMIQVIVYLLLTPTRWLSLHYQPLKSSWLPITVSETPENIKYNLIKDKNN
jgi:hypothetical protein